jgi:hypothetical protein
VYFIENFGSVIQWNQLKLRFPAKKTLFNGLVFQHFHNNRFATLSFAVGPLGMLFITIYFSQYILESFIIKSDCVLKNILKRL